MKETNVGLTGMNTKLIFDRARKETPWWKFWRKKPKMIIFLDEIDKIKGG